MKEQDKIKTKKDVINYIEAYIDYRGGLSNRIDARDILDHLNGKRRIQYKQILKKFKETN